MQRSLRSGLVLAAPGIALATAAVPLAGCGGSSPPRFAAQPLTGGQTATVAPPARTPLRAPASTRSPGQLVVQVRRATALRSRPGGRVLARLAPTTEFHSPTLLPVMRRDGDWYGVISSALPNGRIGWVSARAALARYTSDFRIDVSLGRRSVVVRRAGRTLTRFPVAVGSATTPTPTGRFAITDKLLTEGSGSPYGCCILALSAHQPRTPQGWGGGDRIAIHSTDNPQSIGSAASLGCLRAPTDAMRRIIRIVPLGTIVTIRA